MIFAILYKNHYQEKVYLLSIRSLIRNTLIVSVIFFCSCTKQEEIQISQPNVLFISIDDLNDWAKPLSGNINALTPQLDRFAATSVNFTKNYCTSPGCNPSRSTMLTGFHTYTSGMYSNYQDWRKVPKMSTAKTIPGYFRENGYFTAGAGKIFHYSQVSPESWDDYYPSQKNNMPRNFIPEGAPVNMPEFKYMYKAFDWSPIPVSDEETGDYKSVNYISQQLKKDHDKPFFLATGIYRPHLPWYVPKKYFDMFPIEEIQLPEMIEGDTSDLGNRAKELISRGGNYHRHVVEADQWKQAIQGYLASIAFADAMVGELLDNLAASKYADNTIVVIWSDHGWQLGEKMHWRKFALWENVIRTLLMIHVPEGVSGFPTGTSSVNTDNLTSLLDIYPTLIELCGLPKRTDLDGSSLVPILKEPGKQIERDIITTYDFGDYSIRSENWHFIHYVDDTEELYDLDKDPNEWYNLSEKEEYAQLIEAFRNKLPGTPIPLPEESLIELSEHHIPPVKSKEYYFSEERREWIKRFEVE